ncbi:MAG: phosphoribosylamine--glycine ligase, partial [Methanobacteriota archaeon]
MRVLVVGSGGREHAIAQALAKSQDITVFAAMSRVNPGIAELSHDSLIILETQVQEIAAFCLTHEIGYAFVGPEAPLESGIVDTLEAAGVRCVGPKAAAARIETDKAFCRDLMRRYKIPGLPEYNIFRDPEAAIAFLQGTEKEYAIKPIGLTGGKGVRIMGEHVGIEGACEYVREINGDVVIEERLIGEEFTLQAFVDGYHLVPMPLVQDHKRAYEGDVGPNTGGMGAYTLPDHRMPFVTDAEYGHAISIMNQVVTALASEGTPYSGILYGQFMNTAQGPMVIEFNARFGDPEAMNVLSILDSDMGDIVKAITTGTLNKTKVSFLQKATVCKYIVPEGYPDDPQNGGSISTGEAGPALLYYASVVKDGVHLITQSSRTMAYVGIGDTLDEAELIAESAASQV